ncbi:MAG: class I SAM-dependent methyltransferase [Rubrivivax sp.]|nr:class I SAM-dependent methyltransferase [Rubrivivax sp.]
MLAITLPARAQDEVPFITTPDRVTVAMLELAAVTQRDHVIDLGSGDGRIVITAARRFGASGLGVEIVPELVQRSRDNARAAGVAGRTEFREQDLFATDLARATVVTMYLLPEVNLQLRPRLLALAAGTRIVSHDWDMGDWQPDREMTLEVPDKAIGREKKSRVMLWVVPAQVQGTWCSAGMGGEHGRRENLRLEMTQRFQRFSATLQRERDTGAAGAAGGAGAAGAAGGSAPAPVVVFDGRIEGLALRTESAATAPPAHLRAAPDGATLQLVQLAGAGAAHAGRVFRRAGAGGC